MEKKWLYWAKELQSIAQAGLTYSKDKYDIERFNQIRNLSVQILEEYTNIDNKKIKNLFCNETGYQTPKIDVRGAIFKENKILLVKETIDGCWSMPGGWAEVNLSIRENIIKEVKEEAGVNVNPKRIMAILDRKKYNTPPSPHGIYKIFILCDLIDGDFKSNIETEESRFFDRNNLPKLSLSRNTKDQIEICFNSFNEKELNIIFD